MTNWSGKKVKPVYINTRRNTTHTRERRNTFPDTEDWAASSLRISGCVGRRAGGGRVDFHRGVVRATVTEKVDGAPDGDGLARGGVYGSEKSRHSFVRSSHKLRHPRVKSSLKLRAVDSLMNWVLPPRPLSHLIPLAFSPPPPPLGTLG